MNRLKVISERCSGCRICELMCSMVHYGGAFNPRKALIRVEINRAPQIDTPISEIDIPHVCFQCEPAPCVESCLTGAFEKNDVLEVWRIDQELCTGCEACVEECQYGMIVMDTDRAMKCDLCDGDPVCVRYCPNEALVFE